MGLSCEKPRRPFRHCHVHQGITLDATNGSTVRGGIPWLSPGNGWTAIYDCLAVRNWTSTQCVWTFAQKTAPAPARFLLRTHSQNHVLAKCPRELTPYTQPLPRFAIIFVSMLTSLGRVRLDSDHRTHRFGRKPTKVAPMIPPTVGIAARHDAVSRFCQADEGSNVSSRKDWLRAWVATESAKASPTDRIRLRSIDRRGMILAPTFSAVACSLSRRTKNYERSLVSYLRLDDRWPLPVLIVHFLQSPNTNHTRHRMLPIDFRWSFGSCAVIQGFFARLFPRRLFS